MSRSPQTPVSAHRVGVIGSGSQVQFHQMRRSQRDQVYAPPSTRGIDSGGSDLYHAKGEIESASTILWCGRRGEGPKEGSFSKGSSYEATRCEDVKASGT